MASNSLTVYYDPYEAVFAEKLVIVFKSNLNVQPAKDKPSGHLFARIQGDLARAMIPEDLRLVTK
jgi:hypothetical protein